MPDEAVDDSYATRPTFNDYNQHNISSSEMTEDEQMLVFIASPKSDKEFKERSIQIKHNNYDDVVGFLKNMKPQFEPLYIVSECSLESISQKSNIESFRPLSF